MSSKQGKAILVFMIFSFDIQFMSVIRSVFDPLLMGFVKTGGKAKPLKQPKADKKEYDEVNLLLIFCLRV